MAKQKNGYSMFFAASNMIVRMFFNIDLCNQKLIRADEKQCNYLFNVLRLKVGDVIYVFNGKSGEYEAEISELSRKKGLLKIGRKIKDFKPSPDVWLLFAPLKKDNTDMVIQKATELGVRKIIPVITARTNSEKVRTERFIAQSIEASEQCRRLDVPEIAAPELIENLLKNWPDDRTLFFLNESGSGSNILQKMRSNSGKAAILIGPEGGFNEDEIKKVLENQKVCDIYLGERILRAETAAIAALSCWQAVNGDW